MQTGLLETEVYYRIPLPVKRWMRLAMEFVFTVAAAAACGYLILFTR